MKNHTSPDSQWSEKANALREALTAGEHAVNIHHLQTPSLWDVLALYMRLRQQGESIASERLAKYLMTLPGLDLEQLTHMLSAPADQHGFLAPLITFQ